MNWPKAIYLIVDTLAFLAIIWLVASCVNGKLLVPGA